MSIHDSIKLLCQTLLLLFLLLFSVNVGTFTLKSKKNNISVIYSIMAQAAQSRHQLVENLTWKEGHNRRLFTKFRILRS